MNGHMSRQQSANVVRSPSWNYTSKVTPPYRQRRVTVVGEAPNGQGKDKYDTISGKRLREWAGEELPWWNIHGALPPKWSSRVSAARVEDWLSQHPLEDEPLILLGRKVQAAFGLPGDAAAFEWYASPLHRHSMIVFPHTSPRNHFWNDAEHVREATELLRALVTGTLPHYDYKRKKT